MVRFVRVWLGVCLLATACQSGAGDDGGSGDTGPAPVSLDEGLDTYLDVACECWATLDFGDLAFQSKQECVELLIHPYDRCEAQVLDEAADATQVCRLDELTKALDCMRGAGCPTGNISKWQQCDAIRTDSWYTCPQPSDAVMMETTQTCG